MYPGTGPRRGAQRHSGTVFLTQPTQGSYTLRTAVGGSPALLTRLIPCSAPSAGHVHFSHKMTQPIHCGCEALYTHSSCLVSTSPTLRGQIATGGQGCQEFRHWFQRHWVEFRDFWKKTRVGSYLFFYYTVILLLYTLFLPEGKASLSWEWSWAKTKSLELSASKV